MSDGITLHNDESVAHVIVDRPPVNSLTRDSMAELIRVFDTVNGTPAVRAVVLSATGRVFCAGSDLKARAATITEASESEYRRLARELNSTIADCRIPVIAAVDGPALGGGLCLVAAADIVVASPRATFGLPEVSVGLLGGSVWAARLFGARWARRMMLTAEHFDLVTLLASGAGSAIEVSEVPLETASALAHSIARKSPAAIQLAKQALNDVEFMEFRSGYRHEQHFTARLRNHPDSAEAVSAFLEKRDAAFTDGVAP